MSQQRPEVDWEQTGPQERSKYIYLNFDLKNTHKIRRGKADDPDAEFMDAFSGVLRDIFIEWDGEQHGDTPPHFNYDFILEAKDPRSEGELRLFCLRICSHWSNSMLSDFVNSTAGALDDPNWNLFMKVSLWAKEVPGKRKKHRLMLYDNKGKNLPQRFKWNDNIPGFEGVPGPENGDYSKQEQFWHNLACELAFEHFGNPVKNEPPLSQELEHNRKPATPPPASTEKKPEPSKRDKFMSLLGSRFAAISGQNIEDLEKLWSEVTKGGDAAHLSQWGTSFGEVEDKFTAYYRVVTGDAEGKFVNGKIIANVKTGDDLPF